MNQIRIVNKNRNRIYLGIIFIYFFIALFASLLANEKPLFVSINGKHFYPAISNDPYMELPDSTGNYYKIRTNTIDWKNLQTDQLVFPPVCWSPTRMDLLNTYSSPFAKQQFYKEGKLTDLPTGFRHFLGTGKTGNDVLAGLIHGTRTSVSIGFFSIAIAILLGIFLGGLAGYLGDEKLKISRGHLIVLILLLFPAWFYSFHLRFEILKESFSISLMKGIFQFIFCKIIFILILSIPFLIQIKSSSFLNKKIYIPVDSFISRFIEIFLSLPRLILILTIAAISRPSVLSIILIIGLTSWTEIARIMRAQVLQLRELNYVAAAKAFGTGTMKILVRHLLPNAMSQILVIGTIGIASAILTETGLSFLGVGVPAGTATWGSLMFEAKENYEAWWLVLFTGVTIFLLLSALYQLGNIIKSKAKNSARS